MGTARLFGDRRQAQELRQLLRVRESKASERRFSGAHLTGFGAL